MSIETKEKTKIKIKKPSNYKVIMINDDITPMDFVVEILKRIFNHNSDNATALMMEIHESGAAVVGIYTHEIAETKVNETQFTSKLNNFPLVVKMEEE